jgi:hypothetical protein
MNGPARMNRENIDQTIASFDLQIRQDPTRTAWTLATTIIGHFLGKEWVLQNIPHRDDAASTGFFQMDFSSPERGHAKAARIYDLAETLFNLQQIEGFDHRIEQMRTGDAEASFAELDLGRFLRETPAAALPAT